MKLIFSLLLPFSFVAQIDLGTNSFVEYHHGTLPIIISVPHDGALSPDNIPDRTCNNPTSVTDFNTYKLAMYIDSSLFSLSSCHPHLIFCNLKRTKLDCNRDIDEAACGNPDAALAWTEYHNFIRTADSIASSNNRAFYFDIHGHGHDLQQIELGYLYDEIELSESDEILNNPNYIEKSSFQNLSYDNENNLSNAQILRGEFAFGTLLTNASFPTVPSLQFPNPGSNPYFTGGYSTQVHSSFSNGVQTNGVQMEFNFDIRQSDESMGVFADSMAKNLLKFIEFHTSQNLNFCSDNNDIKDVESSLISIFPNPSSKSISLSNKKFDSYELLDLQGKAVKKGLNTELIDISDLQDGNYFLKCTSFEKVFVYKVMVSN